MDSIYMDIFAVPQVTVAHRDGRCTPRRLARGRGDTPVHGAEPYLHTYPTPNTIIPKYATEANDRALSDPHPSSPRPTNQLYQYKHLFPCVNKAPLESAVLLAEGRELRLQRVSRLFLRP